MGSRAGAEWARHKAIKQKRQQEKQEKTRVFIETQIEWQLPESMLPVRCKKFKQKKWSIFNVQPCWYINSSDMPQSFIYVLKEFDTNETRYVGITDDPTSSAYGASKRQ